MKNAARYIIGFSFLLMFSQTKLNAQSEISTFLKAGVSDANKLVEAYVSPFGNAFGSSLNSGWFNTAENHKIAGFDLTVSMNGVYVPKDIRTFDFSSINTEKLKLMNSTDDPMSPTIFGKNKPGPNVAVMVPNPMFGNTPGASQDTALTSFQLPKGSGINFIALPNMQLRVGTIKKTDIIVRYIPKTKIPFYSYEGKLDLWGVGVMHDLKQWLPFMGLVPIDLSAQAAYSRFSFSVDFPNTLVPDAGAIYANGMSPFPIKYATQGFEYNVSAYNLNLILSKKILLITIYGAVGYELTSGNIKIGGYYPIPVGLAPSGPNQGKQIIEDFQDPIDAKFLSSSPRVTLGLRYKLAVLTIHGDYTYSKFPSANIGVGLSVR